MLLFLKKKFFAFVVVVVVDEFEFVFEEFEFEEVSETSNMRLTPPFSLALLILLL